MSQGKSMNKKITGDKPELISIGEVAKLLRVTTADVKLLVKSGKLTRAKTWIGWYFSTDEIERYLREVVVGLDRRYINTVKDWKEFGERRKAPRSNCSVRCEITSYVPAKKELGLTGVVKNVSKKGLFVDELALVKGRGRVEVGDPVTIMIRDMVPMEGDVIHLYGRRQHDMGKGFLGFGVWIKVLSDQDYHKLKELAQQNSDAGKYRENKEK